MPAGEFLRRIAPIRARLAIATLSLVPVFALTPPPAFSDATPRIVIDGLQAPLRDNALKLLALAREDCASPRWRIERRFRKADAQIRMALRALGYYRPTVKKRLQWDKDCWSAHFSIQPGPPIRLRELDIRIEGEASQDPAFRQWRRRLPLALGAPLRHDLYEAAKRQLLDLAAERGYFRARFRLHRLEVDPQTRRGAIRLHFDSGPRFHIQTLRFSDHTLDEALLRRIIVAKEGQPYSVEALLESQRRLLDSGYFSAAEILPAMEEAGDRTVPLDIRLMPRKRHYWQMGLGWSSNLGPTLRMQYENRYLNGKGYRMSAAARWSPIRQEVDASLHVPLAGRDWRRLDLTAGWVRQETEDVRDEAHRTRLGLSGQRGEWTLAPFVQYEQSHATIGGRTTNARLLTAGLSWETLRIDDLLHPREGRHLQLTVQGAAQGALSDASLLHVHAYGKILRPMGKGVGIARLELGRLLTPDFDRLPASLRFFAGGDDSVRGYGYRMLAPRNADGKLTGGRWLATASLEYEYPIGEKWGAAIFADSGNAFDDIREGLKTGVGVGLRWYTPVGPIRMDIGVPLDDPRTAFRLHFSFGTRL